MKAKVDKKTGHKITDKRTPVIIRLSYLAVSIFLSVILYKHCLFNPNINSIVAAYFCTISLTCLMTAGLPVDKVINNLK